MATLSFVPTPSVLDTSTGSFMPAKLQANMPPNDPMSERTPGVKVSRASFRMRFLATFDFSMSTPASLYVIAIYSFRLFLQTGFPQFELPVFNLVVRHRVHELDRILPGITRGAE